MPGSAQFRRLPIADLTHFMFKDIEIMKKTIKDQLSRAPRSARDQALLEQKLAESRERERKYREQIDRLGQQLSLVMDGKADPELERLKQENQRLIGKVDEFRRTSE